MSLLDDVSIVVTPNAYKASKLYAVLPTNVEGSELVTDGDFPTGSSAWNFGAGWSIANNKAVVDNASTTALTQSGLAVITGKKYNVSFEISDYVSGGFQFQFGGSQVVGSVNANGVYNFSAISTVNTTVLYLYATGDCEFKVDNVTCKQDTGADMSVTRATAATRVDENGLVNFAEVLGSELITDGDFPTGTSAWTLPSNITLANNKLDFQAATGSATQTPVNTVNGRTYKVIFTVSDRTAGSVEFNFAGTSTVYGTNRTTNGTFTQYITTTSNNHRFNLYASGFTGKVDNVSVKEVDRNNVPRIDYTGGGCPHILAEPQRTNFYINSEDFSQSNWVKNASTITINAVTSPDGSQNADNLLDTTANNLHGLYQTYSATANDIITATIFVKKNNKQFMSFLTNNNGSSDRYAYFDLVNKTTHSLSTGITASIETYNNDWLRLSVTSTSGGGNPYYWWNIALSNSTSVYTGDGTGSVYIWGAQLEKGSYPTSYIPTSGSTVTRNQDQFTRDGIASLINSTAGVFFIEMAALLDEGTTADKWIALSDGTANNSVRIAYSGGANTIRAYLNVGGSAQADMTYAVTNVTQFSKIAFSYAANNFNLWVDGVKRVTDTSGSVFSANTLNRLGLDNGGGGSFPGKIKQLQVYKTALTDAQLTSLTS